MKNLYERYLNLIGVKTIPAGIDGLCEIVHNHLCRVPFENVSKLLLHAKGEGGRPITLPEFLDGVEFQDLGGTCHSSNPYLHELLTHSGYKTHLLGANMDEPNVHTCLRAELDSRQYHIDVGYAAPFRAPFPLDKTPYRIKHGKYTYLFTKNESLDKYEIAIYLDGDRIHGYIINEDFRKFDFFHKTIKESYEIGTTFMSCIRITRFFKDRTVELKNKTLIHYKGDKSHSRELKDIGEVENAVKNDLMMPNCPVKKAIRILEQVTRKSFFENDDYPEAY